MSDSTKHSAWMSIEEAAEYLGLGKTVVYTLVREGGLPASKIGKKWLVSREQLDSWIQSNKPVEQFFLNLDAEIEGNPHLRVPQREAYQKIYEYFLKGGRNAIIQIPVGCGKSGLASIIPLGIAKGRVLVISPNLNIKEGLLTTMDVSNRQKCFWRKAKVLTDTQMLAGPYACTLDTGNISVAEKSHIIITNIHQLSANTDKWLNLFPDKFFDLIIVDEAHHSAATSWKRVFEKFPEAKVVQMTATPFRSDRKELIGDMIYRYSFRSATLKGYIKRLKASYVVPEEIELTYLDSESRIYTTDEVLQLKEEDWFSKEIALAPPCNQHIVDSSLEKVEQLRRSGAKHQIIAVACTINHARNIRSMYRERGYEAEVIHSNMSDEEKNEVILALTSGRLDCIIQVQMLGEGFDHPTLSVAAIFRPFRSLAPYIQFVGRIMRVIVQEDPYHPDNLGHIVTHIGMNLDQRLQEFKDFERDDQAFWETVIGGTEPEIPKEVMDGSARRKVSESSVVVNREIIESLWEEDFTSAEDGLIIDDLRSRLEALGLDPSMAESIVKSSKVPEKRVLSPTEPFAVLPQREWSEARRRLHEQSERAAKILLNNVDLEMAGREMPFVYKDLRVSGKGNFVCALIMVNREIAKVIKKERQQFSIEDFRKAEGLLGDIVKHLTRQIKKVQSKYDKDT